MLINPLKTLVVLITLALPALAAPPIELEIATEQGVQITAPQQWLQLLTAIGIEQVQIRGIRAGDQPSATNRGTKERPSYHVVGVLTARDQLRLPGGTFTQADRAKLKDFFARLAADGEQSLTAPKGRFGPTEQELKSVLVDLAQSIDFETKAQQPRAVLDRFKNKLMLKVEATADAQGELQDATPFVDELKGVAAGTGFAIFLRNYGLVMRPEKLQGKPVVYSITKMDVDSISQSTLGKTTSPDSKFWPIGWEPDRGPGAIAPSLMESLNAEIDGYTLEEALAAIGPRLKVPMYIDQAALTAHKIEPAKIQVKLAKARMIYKRLLDRVLAQARLGSSVRIDENGSPFLWITR